MQQGGGKNGGAFGSSFFDGKKGKIFVFQRFFKKRAPLEKIFDNEF